MVCSGFEPKSTRRSLSPGMANSLQCSMSIRWGHPPPPPKWWSFECKNVMPIPIIPTLGSVPLQFHWIRRKRLNWNKRNLKGNFISHFVVFKKGRKSYHSYSGIPTKFLSQFSQLKANFSSFRRTVAIWFQCREAVKKWWEWGLCVSLKKWKENLI